MDLKIKVIWPKRICITRKSACCTKSCIVVEPFPKSMHTCFTLTLAASNVPADNQTSAAIFFISFSLKQAISRHHHTTLTLRFQQYLHEANKQRASPSS
ncbi:hypothetical protein HanRHA438_Chr08g0349561 [Helianthus annuus]|nr:hypothetical protein HanRHA438_Chr08g0349561 [Helianthus annuus]